MRWSCGLRSLPRQYAAALRLGRPPWGAGGARTVGVAPGPPPVRGGAAHQPERRDVRRGGQVRPPAGVLPGELAVLAEVVVDGQLPGAHLDVGALDRRAG